MKRNRIAGEPAEFLNQQEAAALLGVGTRKFNELRREPWFPKACELGPRTLRYKRSELLTAQPPVAHKRQEPAHLAASRRVKG